MDNVLHAAEEYVLLTCLRSEQQRRQRRREGKRVEGRNRNREGDGQRKLFVQQSRSAREERYRHEHRDQHQRRCNDRAGNFAHRVRGRHARVGMLLAHVPLDVLDDHDGIVDHQAGCQHNPKERQRIDGEVQQLDESERPNQRHGNRNRRNQRAAPILQEEEHHQHDAEDRLSQCLQHFLNRVADEGRGIEGDGVYAEPGGKRQLQAIAIRHERPCLRRGRWRLATG